MFDNLLQTHWVTEYLPGFLGGLAAFLVAVGMAFAIRSRKKSLLQDEEWRDPPPVIYRLFKPIVNFLTPEFAKFIKQERRDSLSNKLSASGFNYAILPDEFVTLKFVCCVFGGLISFLLLKTNPDVGPEIFIFIISFAPVGFFYPDLWLSDQLTRRRKAVIKEFPFLLDLLVLGMRAGLNYSGALSHAVAAMPQGAIREEFNKLLREIRAGKPRREALLALGQRMNLEAVNNFVAAINQVEETGGEIVDVLMAQAEQRRNERFNSAETIANKAPIRMLIPMMVFLFPIIFMLLTFIIIVKLNAINLLPASMAAMLR